MRMRKNDEDEDYEDDHDTHDDDDDDVYSKYDYDCYCPSHLNFLVTNKLPITS